MASVTLDHVVKVYPGGVPAVRDLNLQVADGELVVLVGPSGSGKTTTLRLIAGLEEPSAGTIRLGDRVVNGVPPRARDVAMVFQRHNLYPHLSVRGNLAFGLRLRDPQNWLRRWLWRCLRHRDWRRRELEIQERIAATARLLGLEDVLERLPAQLSGGQQQRAALGRALVREPAVFLLDEPLSNLDLPLRNDLRRELHLLHRRICATMIHVTHDQMEAMTLGQRIVVLDQGVVQQADRPVVVYEHPRNRFVAGFIGWPPMNFLEGELAREKDSACFVASAGRKLPLPIAKTALWAAHAGRSVTLGIRPEHVGLDRGERRGGSPPWEALLTMEVALVEPLGSDSLATFFRDDWRVTARIDPQATDILSGQTAEVRFDMRHVYLFDRDSGLNLGAPAG